MGVCRRFLTGGEVVWWLKNRFPMDLGLHGNVMKRRGLNAEGTVERNKNKATEKVPMMMVTMVGSWIRNCLFCLCFAAFCVTGLF